MNQIDAIKMLTAWGQKGVYVFTKHDLTKLFPHDSPKTFTEGLSRLVKAGILRRACRGVFVNEAAALPDGYTLERIAKALRRGEYSYVSLESMLSEYGAISQVPVEYLTLMTTGRHGVYKTPYGTIELTHTKCPVSTIIESTHSIENRPLRIATPQKAWRDLKRVGRNVSLVDVNALEQVISDQMQDDHQNESLDKPEEVDLAVNDQSQDDSENGSPNNNTEVKKIAQG